MRAIPSLKITIGARLFMAFALNAAGACSSDESNPSLAGQQDGAVSGMENPGTGGSSGTSAPSGGYGGGGLGGGGAWSGGIGGAGGVGATGGAPAQVPDRDAGPGPSCRTNGDCLVQPSEPPGCAESICDPALGTCVVRTIDGDGDTFRSAHCALVSGDPVAIGADCDDSKVDVHPGVPEDCNGYDDNCNGEIDEALPLRAEECWSPGLGVCRRAGNVKCVAGGWNGCSAEDAVPTASDDRPLCDDGDYNCDGMPGSGCACKQGETQTCSSECGTSTVHCQNGSFPTCTPPSAKRLWCLNQDGDPYADCGSCQWSCENPSGYVLRDLLHAECDCDDRHPRGSTEVCDEYNDYCDVPEPPERCVGCGDRYVGCGQTASCGGQCPPGMENVNGTCTLTATYGYFSFGQDDRGAVVLGNLPVAPPGAEGVTTRVETIIGIPVACSSDGGGGCCEGGSKVVATLECDGGSPVNITAGQFNTGRTPITLDGCPPGAQVRLVRIDNAWTACAHFTCCGCGCARRFYETRLTTTANFCRMQ